MSTFNTVRITSNCPACNVISEFELQFRYGSTWQHSYERGDELVWGRNDVGVRHTPLVWVHAIGSSCSSCGVSNRDFVVIVKSNYVLSARPKCHGDTVPEGGYWTPNAE